MEVLAREAAGAISAGQLEGDPDQLAFELHAYVQEANWAFQLHGDAEAFRRAERAIDHSLRSRATPDGISLLEDD
jgi:hypothetical protein